MSPPVVILVKPQLGQNIGTAARAMANFGLRELRLVAPRDGWPNPEAVSAASGADWVLEGARVFERVEDALADLHYVLATTARVREMVKPMVTAEHAAVQMHARAGQGQRCGVLFGPERTGLDNDAVALAQAVLRIPVHPDFTSINLAQSVLLIGYEWFRHADDTPDSMLETGLAMPAEGADLLRFFEHLEGELDRSGFLRPPEKRPSMVRALRNIFQRVALTDQDVRTLRGVISSLTTARQRRENEKS
ncbi:MAG TPA: rRNA methyltransferase [Alphaproteobacteria bacterium]|nr:rRNA methyltransferase [Alphaproteobacteria bacterium]HBC55083.1 rRNA methyltransferase [Alphaproteobacteria bacterium]HBF97844.1 rRNA methyltransferase [Alphaproteobacteria bacterium]